MITKTQFIAGCQCPLRLWLEVHQPHLARPLDPPTLDRFEQGRQVGGVARQIVPGGVLVSTLGDINTRVQLTQRFLEDSNIPAIFEGVFVHDGVMVRVDILRRTKNSKAWDLLEAKSSTEAKEEHIPDVAVQAHVMRASGVPLNSVGILHLDRDYRLGTEGLDVDSLFTFENLTSEANRVESGVVSKITEFRNVVNRTEQPDVSPGPHCRKPWDCPFTQQCHPAPGRFDVSQLPRAGKLVAELHEKGIDDLRDLPRGVHLTSMQRRVRKCVVSGKEYEGPDLRQELEAVRWPLAFPKV